MYQTLKHDCVIKKRGRKKGSRQDLKEHQKTIQESIQESDQHSYGNDYKELLNDNIFDMENFIIPTRHYSEKLNLQYPDLHVDFDPTFTTSITNSPAV